jgi:diguanylate cyclase
LATRVAANVGEHSSRVQAISSELTKHGEDGPLESTVLGAVAQIIDANERLEQQLRTAEVKLQEQAHQIEIHAADAMTDALTGVPNRRLFDVELKQRVAEWQRKKTPFCLMMVDVDHFKNFNDVHGHLAGDEVLRGVARSLRETLRSMDIVARYGGEEFAVIMPSTILDESEVGAARTCTYLEGRQFEFEGKTLKVTVSGGLAQADAGEDEANLIKRADEALYAAKNGGRNCVYLHDGQTVRRIGAAALHPTAGPALEKSPATKATPSAAADAIEPAGDAVSTDVQTGLLNRTAFCEEVRRRVAESHRYDSKLSLMLVKVDKFTGLKGRHGTPAVELVLKTVAQFLTAGMREMDLVARYGDDVFAVLLPGTPLSQAVGVGERLRLAVGRCPLRGKDFELRITVSAGLAEVERTDDSAALLKRGEAAMQNSVQTGCDCTHFHNGQAIEPFALKVATA